MSDPITAITTQPKSLSQIISENSGLLDVAALVAMFGAGRAAEREGWSSTKKYTIVTATTYVTPAAYTLIDENVYKGPLDLSPYKLPLFLALLAAYSLGEHSVKNK